MKSSLLHSEIFRNLEIAAQQEVWKRELAEGDAVDSLMWWIAPDASASTVEERSRRSKRDLYFKILDEMMAIGLGQTS